MPTIEDIILDKDGRGISELRSHLPNDFCTQAAQLILDNPGHAFICSGFYILAAGAPETDGPPGAYLLGRTLQALGYRVTQVTDIHSAFLYKDLPTPVEVLEFPIADVEESKGYAQEALSKLKPSVVISTERCGLTAKGRYLNMRGKDISPFNAKLDYLVLGHPNTVGIGDGGNEIGMGNLASKIPAVASLPSEPTTVTVSRLIIASVSNWGVHGLIAALSLLSNRNLLPSVEEEASLIRNMVDKGAVEGITAEQVYSVDGFPLDEYSQNLTRLHALLKSEGLTSK